MTVLAAAVAAAFEAACRDELDAPKPGNVHVFADGYGWTASDFIRSAQAAAPMIAEPGAKVGTRILNAVKATAAAIGYNSNLGIILLCAPLACAAEAGVADLRQATGRMLASLDIEDADLAFRAIAMAAPGGLGEAPRHDVWSPAVVGLQEAMAEAADRDRVALQFANGFADIFDMGVAAHAAAMRRWDDPVAATLLTYMTFLTTFPDSHIARKHGVAVANCVRSQAVPWIGRLHGAADPRQLTDDLLTFDADLKRRGLNPGTSADLTVATLFAIRLKNVLPPSPKNA